MNLNEDDDKISNLTEFSYDNENRVFIQEKKKNQKKFTNKNNKNGKVNTNYVKILNIELENLEVGIGLNSIKDYRLLNKKTFTEIKEKKYNKDKTNIKILLLKFIRLKCNLYEDIYYFYIIIIKQLEPSFDIYINENKSPEIEDNKELKFVSEEDYHNNEGKTLNKNYQKTKRNKLQKLSLNFNIHIEFISNKYIEIPLIILYICISEIKYRNNKSILYIYFIL